MCENIPAVLCEASDAVVSKSDATCNSTYDLSCYRAVFRLHYSDDFIGNEYPAFRLDDLSVPLGAVELLCVVGFTVKSSQDRSTLSPGRLS